MISVVETKKITKWVEKVDLSPSPPLEPAVPN